MVDKTTEEFRELDNIIGGEVHIGCAESYLIKYIAQTIKDFKEKYPLFRYHLTSGNPLSARDVKTSIPRKCRTYQHLRLFVKN